MSTVADPRRSSTLPPPSGKRPARRKRAAVPEEGTDVHELEAALTFAHEEHARQERELEERLAKKKRLKAEAKTAVTDAIATYDAIDCVFRFDRLLELMKEHKGAVLEAMGLVCWLRHTPTRTPEQWELKIFDRIADLLAGDRFAFEVAEETLENVGVSAKGGAL